MNKLLSRALVPVVGALALVTMAGPAAHAGSFRPCDGGETQVCYDETGTTPVAYAIPNLGAGEHVEIADVAAYLDIYQVPLGTGGVNIPCVTAVDNGTERNACGMLGLTRISRTPLVAEGAAVDLVKVDGVIVTLYVCTAEITATVANIGVTKLPTLTACADNPETVWNMIPNGW